MKQILWIFLAVSFGLYADGIYPRQFKVELPKACQVLMLNKTPDRKAKKIFTYASTGDCVENMGCIREITQNELDSMEESKRQYASWKYPVWCKVSVGNKQGWILQQYVKKEPCIEL